MIDNNDAMDDDKNIWRLSVINAKMKNELVGFRIL